MPIFDAASSQGMPAPYWLVEFFKTLGFALHMIPMGLWLVGIPTCLLLWLLGGVTSKRLAQRFFQQIPVIVAFGVCSGVLPLLFTQLAYPKAFYTSTILLGAHWFAIIPLFLIAYYASCFAASGAKAEKIWRTAFYVCVASCCYFVIGLIFSSVWTFFERPYEWESIWSNSSISLGKVVSKGGGTSNGLGVYWSDLTIPLRFAGIVGMGFFALATWFVFDAYYLYRGPRKLTAEEQSKLRAADSSEESGEGKKARVPRKPIQENAEKYAYWTTSLAFLLLLPGLLIAAAAIGKYALQSSASLEHDENWNPVLWNVLLGGMGASMVFPFLFILLNKLKKIGGRTLAIMLIICEGFLVGFYATMRQILQNIRLRPYFNVCDASASDSFSWLPIISFFVILALVSSIIIVIVSILAPHDKKRSSRKPRKAAKELKTSDSGKSESKEPQKNVSGNVQRTNAVPNTQQIRTLNGRSNLRRQ